MAEPADDRKHRAVAVYEAIANSYDSIRFTQVAAHRLVELVTPYQGARVLDVATGSGWAALAAARCVGATGSVLGIDLATGLLERARQKARDAGLKNVEFQEADGDHLGFPDQSFDIALCSLALFYFPDMLAALRGWRRLLVPGGQVGFSWWGPSFRQPLSDLWRSRLEKFGVVLPTQPNQTLRQPDTCRRLLNEAGFTQVRVRNEQLGYYFNTIDEYWAEVMASVFGFRIKQLDPASREQFKTEHLAEVEALATADGIWADSSTNFAFGRK